VLAALLRYYGKPTPPISADPCQLILWEQVAYHVPDARRRAAFQTLRTSVGLTPVAILAAPIATLRAIARQGGSIASSVRAERLQRSAELVISRFDGDLRNALRLPLAQARKALARFAMIGEPGADKILTFTKSARVLPLDSNALRVVQRLGLATEAKDYRSSYRQAQAALAPQLPKSPARLIAAAQLLRQHGQELCRRSVPECARCPVRSGCPYPTRGSSASPPR
jgi:endonuclease-3